MNALRARRFTRAALSLVLLGAIACACLSGCGSQARPLGVIEPHIDPSPREHGSRTVTRNFAFDGGRVRLSVPVDRAVYAGSVNAEKSAVFLGRADPGDWVPGYYRAFVAEKHQTGFYDSMAKALHRTRQERRLDQSQYVELVTSMVQEMRYRTDPASLAPKFPIETFGDGYGDCDDKTLLAAALLARDGYDVAILMFAPEEHVALGIRAPGLDYKHTGYAYVEMTQPSLVGAPAKSLANGVKLSSQPLVIRIGQAGGAYAAGPQIKYILRKLQDVEMTVQRLDKQISDDNAALAERRHSLALAKREIQAADSPTSTSVAVQRFNQQVAEYNKIVARADARVSYYNRLVETQRFVADHQTARPQVYARLRTVDR